MSELKFRAWCISKQAMFEVVCVYSDGGCKRFPDSDYFNSNEVKLMQHTGLKDKNGKEIYEGDILVEKSPDYDHTHTADCFDKDGKEICDSNLYSHYEVKWGYSSDMRYGWIFGDSSFTKNWNSEDYEISGNIYENNDAVHAEGEQ